MKEQIDHGIPVIYSGKRYANATTDTWDEGQDKKGHQLIAYGVDESGDVLLHTGWSEEEHTSLEDDDFEFTINKAIIYIEIKDLPHSHSYHYIETNTGESLCACQIYSKHDEHENNHIYSMDSNDDNSHFKACHCGEKTDIQPHDFMYDRVNQLNHSLICNDCGYTCQRLHKFNSTTNISDSEHRLDCACGWRGSTTEAHYAHNYSPAGTLTHWVFCSCGAQIGLEAHNMMGMGFSSAVCVDCGYVGKQPSGNIIMGKEDDNDLVTE